jgi:hypothetical protein
MASNYDVYIVSNGESMHLWRSDAHESNLFRAAFNARFSHLGIECVCKPEKPSAPSGSPEYVRETVLPTLSEFRQESEALAADFKRLGQRGLSKVALQQARDTGKHIAKFQKLIEGAQ